MSVNDVISASNLDVVWKDTWDKVKTAHSADTGQEEALWKVAGRATKENPDKENGTWWFKAGREMLDSWVKFRTGELGWQIWQAPNGVPAIEIGMNVDVAGVPVQMGIDRVMVTSAGELVILDLKTGQRTPSSDLQLAFYALGMSKTFGVRPQYGAYWMARQGITSPLIELDFYTDDMIEEIIVKFDTARKAELFIPNYNHCKMCGFTTICKYNKEGK